MDPRQIYARLRRFPVFNKWRPEDLRHLARIVGLEIYDRGESIFQAHRGSDDAFIISRGRVRQVVQAPDGSEWEFRTLGEGDVFGKQTLFRGQRYASTTVAETPTEVFRVAAADLGWILNRYPDLWKKLIQPDTSARLRAVPLLRSLSDAQIEHLAQSTTTKEFAAGQQVARFDDPDAALWIIDWGQIDIVEQAEVGLTAGNLVATAPSAQVMRDQGFDLQRQPRLTAGNWFVSGLVKLPNQLTVTARATTRARLLRVPGTLLLSMVEFFDDLHQQLQQRVPIDQLVRQLATHPIFSELSDRHWQHLSGFIVQEHVPSGVTVTHQGEKSLAVHQLLAGGAVIRAYDEQGRERPRQYIWPYYFYGVDSMLAGLNRETTVRSTTTAYPSGEPMDGTDWLVLHREDLLYMMREKDRLWHGTPLKAHLIEAPKKKRFDWLEDEETVEYLDRRHWITLVPAFLLPIGIWILVVLGAALLQLNLGPLASTLTLLLLMLILLPIPIINHFDDYYVITNLRAAHRNRNLFLHEARVEAPLERIQEVDTQSDLLGRIFNYGDLMIRTAATIGTVPFKTVPDPEQVRTVLEAQRRRIQAGRRAEQREQMRNTLLKELDLRMPPQRPKRALAPDTPLPPVGVSEHLALWWKNIGGRWRAFRAKVRKNLMSLVLWIFPERTRRRIMQERKRRQKARDEDAVVYHKHWLFLVRANWLPLLAFVAWNIVLIIIALGPEDSVLSFLRAFPPLVAFVGVAVWLWLLFLLWFKWENWRNDRYILTNSYIMDVEALPFGLREQKRQASWDRIQNAIYEVPSFWANLFNYGTVVVQTAAAESAFTFDHVPRPREVQQEIFRRLERYRLSRERKETTERSELFGETLRIYDELMQRDGWAQDSQRGYPPPGSMPSP